MKTYSRFSRFGGLAALLVAGSVYAGTITNGLVLHLKFDSDYNDSSGRGNHGTAVGAPLRVPGLIGANSLQFTTDPGNSIFDYVTLNNTSGTTPDDLLFGDSTDFTVAFWVNMTNWSGDPSFFSNKAWASGNNAGYVIATDSDGRLQWNLREFDAVGGTGGNVRKDYDGPAGTLGGGGWHHVAMVLERAGNIRTYIDSQLVDSKPMRATGEGPFTIDTADQALAVNIAQDGSGGYTDGTIIAAQMDDVGVWRRLLTDSEVARVYAAGTNGVDLASVQDPSTPFISAASPANGAPAVLPDAVITVTIQDGSTQVNTNSIQFLFDGGPVAPAITREGGTNTVVTYDPPGLLASLSTHTYRVVYWDNGSPVTTATNDYTFKVARDLILPTPLFFEDFDSTAEGSVPTGWVVENFTADGTAGEDLDDPLSDSFKNWVVISRDRVEAIGVLGRWEAARRLNVAPNQLVNSKLVTNLVEGNYFYAESDQRGGSQVQYLFTPSYNLTGKSDIWVVWYSPYEQNQDNIACAEYSVDNGTTWLPILYMVEVADLKYMTNSSTGEVSIDGYETLNAPQGDAATYLDPISGEPRGGYYGAFIGVTSNLWSTLGPYVQGRVNDDTIESKRVEAYRLPQADGKASVKLRFAQAGTASWYFGVDNFGLYSIASAAPSIGTATVSGGSITVTWSGGAGVLLQKATSLSTPDWQDISSTSGQSTFSETVSGTSTFYRLKR